MLSSQDANVVNGNNFSQLFTTNIFGDGRCGPKTLIQYASHAKYDPAKGSEIGKLFMLTAKPVIYSNDEQTLSFIIDVQFQAPQISGKPTKHSHQSPIKVHDSPLLVSNSNQTSKALRSASSSRTAKAACR